MPCPEPTKATLRHVTTASSCWNLSSHVLPTSESFSEVEATPLSKSSPSDTGTQVVSVPHIRAAGSPRSEGRPGEPDDGLGSLALIRDIGSVTACPTCPKVHVRASGVKRPSELARSCRPPVTAIPPPSVHGNHGHAAFEDSRTKRLSDGDQ